MYATLDPSTIAKLSEAQLIDALNFLYKAAYSDPLTETGNRRAFEEEQRQNSQAHRYLFYLDLDGLKQINDTCGHEAGDAYIQKSVEALKAVFRRRPIDKIFRVGGDEFVVLSSYLPDLSGLQMFSIGVAEITNGLESALKEADSEMYKVKQARKKP